VRGASSLLLVGFCALGACTGSHAVEATGPDGGPTDAAVRSATPPMLAVPLMDTPTYGTRLTADHGTDESALPGWQLYDSRWQSHCKFEWAADGQLRCLPTTQVRYLTPTGFADPQCSQPVVVQRPASSFECSGPPPPTLAIASRATCPISYAMHRLGPRLAGNHFELVDGVCRETPGAAAVYQIGEAIAPTEFVSGIRRVGQAKGGIAPVFLEAEDGSRLFRGWHLPALATDCGFHLASDGKLRCLPPAASTIFGEREQYGDALCSTPSTSIPRDACAASSLFVHRFLGDTCGERRFAVHPGLAKHENAHTRSSGACAPGPGSNGTAEYLSYAPEIAPGELVEAQLAISGGSGRVKHLAVVTPAGAARTIRFWDDRLGLICTPWSMADGTTRCLPIEQATSGVAEYFSDDLCTRSLVLTPEGCTTPHAVSYAVRTCMVSPRLFGLTPSPHAGPVYRKTIRCQLAGTLADLKMLAFEAREIAPTELGSFDGR
jgi:hypothetical protein